MSKKSSDISRMSEAFADIKRTRSDKLHLQSRPPAAEAAFTRADQRDVLRESLTVPPRASVTGDELNFCSSGLAASTFRKLRRGRLAVEDEIDLHGLNVAEAKSYLREFIAHAHSTNKKCVRVIHGKGKRSGQRGPVLKTKVDRWLRKWSQVVAFCSARPADGGSGAVYVLLRKN